MFNVSRLVALILAFTLGFAVGAGALVGGVAIALSSFTIRDLEDNGVPIPDEAFIGENPEVDILDLTAIQFVDEVKALTSFGDDLTIDLIQDRYALIFPEKLDAALSDEARQMPLKQLLSTEGLHIILGSVYIGDIEKYECYNADGTAGGDPADETSYWVNADGKRISGIEEIIADFTLDDFISGNINTDALLHGDIILADVLGYTYNEELNGWYDRDNNRVTGVMSVFADCTIDDVSSKINTANIGDLIGYEKDENGNWINFNEETNQYEEVDGFMSKIADNSISSIDNVFGSLEIGDIVPEEDRTGIFAIIPADTKIDEIGGTVNESIMNSPLQFFMNEELISFVIKDQDTGTEKNMDSTLDSFSEIRNDYVKYSSTDADYVEYFAGKGDWKTSTDSLGNTVYLVPTWRTQPLSNSFAYIIDLLTAGV